jgi:DNA-directed RNA polymerase subunit RPC12/RpoP
LTSVLDCPKCGAPLNFEPIPGAETIECPYCHETVIIPKDLRVRLPKVETYEPIPQQGSKRLSRVVIAIVLVVVMGVCAFLIYNDNSSNQSVADFPTDTPDVLSASDSATATVEARATLDVLQPMLSQMQLWPASFVETFKDNSYQWQTGDVRDSYITGNRSVGSGKYTWNVTTSQSTSDFSFPTMPNLTDFYASVDMNLVRMPLDDPDADAGMVLRANSKDSTWYYFSVNTLGQYYFGWYNGTDWYTLIPETDSTAIHVGQTNTLSVGVQGSQFIFVINGQMVDHFIDENLKIGKIGLGINLPQANEKATVEFANLTVLAPSTKP